MPACICLASEMETKNRIVVALAIEQHCRVESCGYSGIKNNAPKDDVQQSFYIADFQVSLPALQQYMHAAGELQPKSLHGCE